MVGTVLQRAKQQRSCLWSKLKPALQLFPGKDCANSALQPIPPGLLEPIAVLRPAPAHPSPMGGLQSISPSKSHVPGHKCCASSIPGLGGPACGVRSGTGLQLLLGLLVAHLFSVLLVWLH